MNKFEIFYINLQKDELRREKMESEFSRLHIDANRIDAIWWCSVSSQDASFLFNAELNEKQYYKPLSNGEKGCYSSHISAWRKLLAGTSKAMVVLEDDICFQVPLKEIKIKLDELSEDERPTDEESFENAIEVFGEEYFCRILGDPLWLEQSLNTKCHFLLLKQGNITLSMINVKK